MYCRRCAANKVRRNCAGFAIKSCFSIKSRSRLDQVLANAENTVSGAWAMTARSARAGPRGRRLPCSQLRMVSTGTPSRLANSSWVRHARRRRSRTAGAVCPGATEVAPDAAEGFTGAATGIAGASGNSRPSRNSTIRPSAFSRRRCMFHPISKRDSGRKTGITFADRASK
jgi:hypothetical protein